MKLRKITAIETPYSAITEKNYQIEKRRLQVELLRIQQKIIQDNLRLVVIFDGRDAAGKGSTIKRFTENLMPNHIDIIQLGVPTEKESKYWFKRYQSCFPKPGEMIFFDRSWYNRALIEPTMGYCTEKQYKYFMRKVLPWEHKHIDNGLLLVKFYLSVDEDTQLFRFEDRLSNPLTYWKFSPNDIKARKKWSIFTRFKEQMFHHTSSVKSPWVVINANSKREARLTAMLYLVRTLGNKEFQPLTGEDIEKSHCVTLNGVNFKGLSTTQLAVLEQLQDSDLQFILENNSKK